MKLILTKWQQNIGAFGFEDNQLAEVNIYDAEQKICVGDIYLAKVHKALPNINAYFVKLGCDEIFLPFQETDREYKMGENILIQIKKEASKGKQPLGTANISLAGVYCVVHYDSYGISVSAKLNEFERAFWKDALSQFLNSQDISEEDRRLLAKYGVIVRTNVNECDNVSELTSEWLDLVQRMDFIIEKGMYQSLYTKLFGERQGYISHLKNISFQNLEEIITDDITVYEELKNSFDGQNEICSKIRYYEDDFSLTKLYCIESKLQEALNKKVWLKSGGFLLIEPTEALTVIDVNSGKCEKEKNSEVYYKKINIEAAQMIARQIKLRNISGIIIIDFINMEQEENRKELLQLLASYVNRDKVKTRVMGMTSLGLVEMTRKKIEKPLWEQIK